MSPEQFQQELIRLEKEFKELFRTAASMLFQRVKIDFLGDSQLNVVVVMFFQYIPGNAGTNRIEKSGNASTYRMVKSSPYSTNCHCPHSLAQPSTFCTFISGNASTIFTSKSANELSITRTFPYRGIPLQVQFSLSKVGSVSIIVLSADVNNVINGIKNENNKLFIA